MSNTIIVTTVLAIIGIQVILWVLIGLIKDVYKNRVRKKDLELKYMIDCIVDQKLSVKLAVKDLKDQSKHTFTSNKDACQVIYRCKKCGKLHHHDDKCKEG